MSNIVSVRGSRDGHNRSLTVRDMTPGMTRYVTEGSIRIEAGNLYDWSPTSRVKHDEFSVRVECIAPHRYAIAYEDNLGGFVEVNPSERVIDPESELQPVIRMSCFTREDADDQP